MATVIDMQTRKSITPNQRTFEYAGQRYTCTYDPNAPPNEQWVWTVEFVQKFRYYGHAPSMQKASKDAVSKIRKLTKMEATFDEHDLSRN